MYTMGFQLSVFYLPGFSLSVWMRTSVVLEMTVVMRFSLGGDRLYSLFSFFQIYSIVIQCLLVKEIVY